MLLITTGVARAIISAAQVLFMSIVTIVMTTGLYKLEWPANTNVEDGVAYDYIIIGSGAGSVVANRLTEDPNVTVLLIEAGMAPSFESRLAGTFVLLQNSYQDWQFKSEPELATQSQYKNVFKVAAGLTLGGSSQINHFIYLRGDPTDFDTWAEITHELSWRYENVVPYFLKTEKVFDHEVLNSQFTRYHNMKGHVHLTRELHEESEKYLNSFAEAGQEKRLDLNGNITYGYTQPFLINDKVRQSTAEAYIKPIACRRNLHVMYQTLVTKINFDNNNNAVSVNTVGKAAKIIKANVEIILAAGVFNSPKLLMLSGIGPKDQLEQFNIPVIQDLPAVGQNLQDHVAVQIVQKMEKSLELPPIPSPTALAFPVIVGAARLNKDVSFPQYQTTNLLLPHDTPYIVLVCGQIVGYKNEICDELQAASVGRNVIYSLVANIIPKSTGTVTMRSNDPKVPPMIKFNVYSDPADLDAMVENIENFLKVRNTTYFKSVNSEPVTPKFVGVDDNFTSKEYIREYVKKMSTSLYHYTSTCAMNEVVTSELKVIGVNRLRVVDASIMPRIPKANPLAATLMIAEKASDMIKQDRANY